MTLIGLGAFVPGTTAHAQAEEPPVRVSRFSGEPVPRFASLRFSAVNGRMGPSLDHRIKWRYERAGLPVLIIKETVDWRQVRDPDGDLVWIAANQLSSRPSALVRGDEMVFLRRKPAASAQPLARLEPGVIVTLGACEKGWCRVESGGRRGWVAANLLWGADPFESGM